LKVGAAAFAHSGNVSRAQTAAERTAAVLRLMLLVGHLGLLQNINKLHAGVLFAHLFNVNRPWVDLLCHCFMVYGLWFILCLKERKYILKSFKQGAACFE
jgi:TRAP-type mannitol/chloroaromatic compound transport system permease small subunit